MVLNCCKLQFIFQSQIKPCNNFHFEGAISQVLTSGAFCKFQCKLCKKLYHGERVRHLTVRSGGDISISTLTSKRVKLRKHSDVCYYLLNSNYSPFFEDFSVMCHKNKKYLLELKESLYIMRDRSSMNRNIHFAPLYLFE